MRAAHEAEVVPLQVQGGQMPSVAQLGGGPQRDIAVETVHGLQRVLQLDSIGGLQASLDQGDNEGGGADLEPCSQLRTEAVAAQHVHPVPAGRAE